VIVATPGALDALQESGQTPEFFLAKHVRGDWGEVCPDDARLNDQALIDGSRLLSAYRTLRNVRIWLITEADLGFAAPLVVVRRKSDGVRGSLEFQHSPSVRRQLLFPLNDN
jgi:hypothetical protein